MRTARALLLLVLLGGPLRAELADDDWRVLMVHFEQTRRDGRLEDALEVLASAPGQDVRLTKLLVKLLGEWREPLLRKRILDQLRRLTDAECLTFLGQQTGEKRLAPVVRHELFVLCGEVKSERLAPVLIERLKDGQAWVRVAALDGLGRRAEPALTGPIAARLADPAWQVRSAAIEALVRRADPKAIGALIERLPRERGWLQADLARALRSLTGVDHPDAAAWARWRAKVGDWLGRQPGDRWEHFLAQADAPRAGQPELFGIPVVAPEVIFIVERSRAIDAAVRKQTLDRVAATLERLPETTRFNLVLAGRRPKLWRDAGAVPATKQHVADALRLLRRNEADKQVDLLGALQAALCLRNYRDPLHPKNFDLPLQTILLLTRGRPDAGKIVYRKVTFAGKSPWNERFALAATGWLRLRRVRLHAIGLGRPFEPLLRELSRISAGRYVAATGG